MNRFPKAKAHNDIHRHTAKSKEQIRGLRLFALALKRIAESLGGFDKEIFSAFGSGLRECAVEHVFPVFGFGISEEAEAGAVFIEGFIEAGFFVPAVFVVVDVVVGLGIGEVELIWGDADNVALYKSAPEGESRLEYIVSPYCACNLASSWQKDRWAMHSM